MVAEKDQTKGPQLHTEAQSTEPNSLKQELPPEQPESAGIPLKIIPTIKKQSKNSRSGPARRPSSSVNQDSSANIDQYAQYTNQLDNPDFAKDPNLIASAALQAVTEASADVKKQATLDSATFSHLPSAAKDHINTKNSNINTVRSHSIRAKLNTFNQNSGHNMELHDATGALLQNYNVNGDSDNPQQEVQPQDQRQDTQAQQSQQQVHQELQTVTPQEGKPAQSNLQTQARQAQAPQSAQTGTGQASTGTGSASAGNAAGTQNRQQTAPKKPTRMPGTKQCPSCQNTIAAAVAKCPKCPHVFREKKEKVKRSGKRGKKNCPKCNFENPSACSSCKSCKHVFRLKLMDKYKAMRPRQANESAAAAAAAAAHAAANMAHGTTAVSAVATVPLPAGVAAYPNQINPQMHPTHVPIMPTMPGQTPIAMHQHTHNVHSAGMPQMHPMPQHPMQHQQQHPQL